MSINKEQILATAKLARLQVEENEVGELTDRISSILDMVDQMQSVDTSAVEPMANSLDTTQQLRPDQIVEAEDKTTRRSELLSNAPAQEDGLFLVPKVSE